MEIIANHYPAILVFIIGIILIFKLGSIKDYLLDIDYQIDCLMDINNNVGNKIESLRERCNDNFYATTEHINKGYIELQNTISSLRNHINITDIERMKELRNELYLIKEKLDKVEAIFEMTQEKK